jgi:ketosteroid isomerase-like protein
MSNPVSSVSGPAEAADQLAEARWQQAIDEQRVALAAYVSGDPGPFRATCSHADDVTIFGGFGGWSKGWRDLEQRTSWASAQYKNGAGVPELLAQGRSGDLAYTVHLEYIAVRSGPSATSVEKTYRVTHIFRREDDAWKLIHRHADPLIDTHPPT